MKNLTAGFTGLGITNQMLTFIPWSKKTGKPFYNAIGKP